MHPNHTGTASPPMVNDKQHCQLQITPHGTVDVPDKQQYKYFGNIAASPDAGIGSASPLNCHPPQQSALKQHGNTGYNPSDSRAARSPVSDGPVGRKIETKASRCVGKSDVDRDLQRGHLACHPASAAPAIPPRNAENKPRQLTSSLTFHGKLLPC